MEAIDAVVLAAGRLTTPEALHAGHEVKALVRIGETTPLRAVIDALRQTSFLHQIIVVGPPNARQFAADADRWIDELDSGESNALAGLRGTGTRRVLLCASDAPFVRGRHIEDFLARVPAEADLAYPVFLREEFLAAFPGGRSKFARVAGAQWTGGSLCLVSRDVALSQEELLRRGFAARRSLPAMASLLGPEILVRYVTGTLALAHIERRLSQLCRGKAAAIRGAHPALAMDCDGLADIEYARAHYASLDRRGHDA